MSQIQSSTSKRYSPLKFTKSTQQRTQNYSPSTRAVHTKLFTNRYYCHYSNAVYMGGMDSYKKNGYGIMLMDSGTCAITEYSHDNMVEVNVVFSDKCMIIITVNKGSKGKFVSFRTGAYLIIFKVNARGIVDGIGYFIDYKERIAYKLEFFGGKIYGKWEILDRKLNQEIFLGNSVYNIVQDKNHARILGLDFQGFGDIACKKDGQFYTFGFYQNENQVKSGQDQNYVEAKTHTRKQKYGKNDVHDHGNMSKSFEKNIKRKGKGHNGLHFRLKINNKRQQFDVILEQRGYKIGDKMQKYGQKHFKNGNYYVGGFKNNNFHGLGMLIDPQQKKWTYNIHRNGQISQILQSSVNGSNQQKISDILKKIHENQDSYIKDSIKISPNKYQLTKLLNSIVQLPNGEPIKCIEQQYHKKLENFASIKTDFVQNHCQESTTKLIKEELSQQKQKNESNSKLKRYINKLELQSLQQKNNRQYQGEQQGGSRLSSNLNKTFGDKNNALNKNKSKNTLQIKSKSKKKLNLKDQFQQPNNSNDKQKYNIKIIDPTSQQKQKQLIKTNELQADSNNNVDKFNKYFKTAQTSHRTHRTTPMNINNDVNHHQYRSKQEITNNDNREVNNLLINSSSKYHQNTNELNPNQTSTPIYSKSKQSFLSPSPLLPSSSLSSPLSPLYPHYDQAYYDNYIAALPLPPGYFLPDFSPTLQQRLAHHRRMAQLEHHHHLVTVVDPLINIPIPNPLNISRPYVAGVSPIYQYQFQDSYQRERERLAREYQHGKQKSRSRERERQRQRQRQRYKDQNNLQKQLTNNSRRRLYKYIDQQKDDTIKQQGMINRKNENDNKQDKIKQASILIQRYRELYGINTLKRS